MSTTDPFGEEISNVSMHFGEPKNTRVQFSKGQVEIVKASIKTRTKTFSKTGKHAVRVSEIKPDDKESNSLSPSNERDNDRATMIYDSLRVVNQRMVSSDLMRTKSYNSSAKLLNPSLRQCAYNIKSIYEDIDRFGYSTPFDRIARLYTLPAVGLAMKDASKVAKYTISAPRATSKVVGYSLAATAPDAFEATSRISDIVNANAMNDTKNKKLKLKNDSKDMITSKSPSALREQHRLMRSAAKYTTLEPSPAPSKHDNFDMKNFNDWNPEPLLVHKNSLDTTKKSVNTLLARKQESISAFYTAVESTVTFGILTAAGSGHKLSVPSLTAKNLNTILIRIPSTNDNLLDLSYLRPLLEDEISTVQDLYCHSVARASLEYSIRDSYEASDLGIDVEVLYDDDIDALWTNKEYQLREWKILRQTGIKAETVMKVFRRMDETLCAKLSIMLQLQYLWIDESPLEVWWESMSSLDRSSYCDIMFTDVSMSHFKARLPVTLEDFTSHIDRHCDEIRDGLIEYWLTAAGTKLKAYVSKIDDTKLIDMTQNQLDQSQINDPNIDQQLIQQLSRDSDEDEEEYYEFRHIMDEANQAQKALRRRMGLEGLEEEDGLPHETMHTTRKSSSKSELILNSAAVLMSRQLRTMCENSLKSLVDLFEKLSQPNRTDYSVFIINMRLRKARKKDITNDFTEPVEVCLQPDLNDLKNGLSACVVKIVQSSRDFPRAETAEAEHNNAETSSSGPGRYRRLNESSILLTDEIVMNTTTSAHAELKRYFDAPAKLLEKFEVLEKLLSGQDAQRVSRTIMECLGAANTIESLESLTAICLELEQMIEMIRNLVPDVSFFPMFEVRCQDLKDLLIKHVRTLHTQIMEAIVEENRNHMISLSSKYQEIANRLIAEVADSSELKALQDYTNKAAVTLADLYDQYVSMCFERTRFLLNQKYKLGRDDVQVIYTIFNWPLNIQTYLRRSYENQSSRKRELEELLEEDQRKLENDLNDIAKRVDLVADNASPMEFRKNVDRINAIKRDLEAKQERAEEIAERETLLEMPHSDHMSRVEEIRAAVDPLDKLWNTVKSFVEKTHVWHESPLVEVDAEAAEKTAEELLRSLIKVSKEFDRMGEKRQTAKRIAESLQNEVKEFLQEEVPLMLLICNPGMKERHWTEIETITGIAVPKGEVLTVNMMLELGLQHHTKEIEETCVAASKEYSLQIALDKMESEWKEMNFNTKEYRNTGTRILQSVDEIQMLLDDHIVKAQAMRQSRYIKPFLEQITKWEETLVTMQDILDNWLKVQATWLYLEPIFSSDDIMRQMPTEGKMFRAVDNTWRESMAQTYEEPGCVKVARRAGFLDSLIEANKKLEQIQKGLNDYLETKRLAFPRFFFLSNDELLEILAETKDPLRVQPHLKKCFDGIAKLQFQSNLDILACYDPKGEKLDFPYEKVNHRKINPNECGGNVEKWLIEVEIMMRKSVAYAIDFAMKDYLESDRLDWLKRWQGQVIICINQVRWCFEVEQRLIDVQNKDGVRMYYEFLCAELLRTVELVRGDIPKQLRIAIGSLVVMDVHNRDVVCELADLKVSNKTDFDWQAQLRYYWNGDGQSAMTGKPGTVVCRMINAHAAYANEYIGNQDRLVITPLTDRCYRTLMGAIHLNLGGAPEGPAGTGKTETTKDLAKAIAIQCVVTNCSDGLDYLAMGKFFKGLASSGAWACFDEFNRIQLEVLSVIAQQIMQIQLAKMKGVERFVFEGTELELRPTCCPFITMNPGYAGRAELPDNLKVLFRTVAMMVPDYAMISEIILYSYGYTNARPLAVKIVTTYKLCSEQLSSQSHYDYGMRAVIAVLRAAGNLKRSDGKLPEDVLVLRSIIDVNLPKFLSPDVPLFNGVVIEAADRTAMRQSFDDVCAEKCLISTQYFWEKVVQIYDMMVVRHGFMVVGSPFSGKSSAWKVLGEVLGLLHDRFPMDRRWSKVIPIVQNPKSITMGQLYGMFDPVSHEWTDGVLAINYRNAASNKIGQPDDRKWILFDGPVDAIWIENMNTVLDDNKKLCLMSGEIIAMTDVMSMMFEPMDLLVASPATVSRCGMIYMEPEQLGWQPILTSWLETHKKQGKFCGREIELGVKSLGISEVDALHVQSLFDWLAEPCLCFVRKEVLEMSPTVDSSLIMALLNLMEALLTKCIAKQGELADPDDANLSAKYMKQRLQDIECCFFFSLVWTIGKTGNAQSQGKFSAFLENITGTLDCIQSDYVTVWNALQIRGWVKPDPASSHCKCAIAVPMPMRNDFYEAVYIPEESKWKTWVELLPVYKIQPNTPYSAIVVPNSYTAQFTFLLELLLPLRRNVLMCGPTGTGKSVYVYNCITSSLPQDKFKPLTLGFSAKTSANMTQDIIDGKLDKRRKGVYGPPVGQQSIIFVDDLNMPEVETYGAQPPIELIRQLIDCGGWYDLKEKTWRTIIDTVVVAAMGPSGGGRNSVTPRLLRHFNLFCFAEFDDSTLRRIFCTIVQWHVQNYPFPSDVRNLADPIVDATLDTYRAAMAHLLPTPQKSHYTFNLRDFSRIIQGVLLSKPSDGFNKNALIRLWSHEALRVFGDRLINDIDRLWFHHHIQTMCATKFSATFYDVYKHLDNDNKKSVNVQDMRNLYFGDYLSPDDGQSRPYNEAQNLTELQNRMEEFLAEYNQQSRKPMDLVLFGFAIEHVSRICRILKMPGGNALLVGVGGSGRQSLTRLASHISGFNVFQIEISKNYSNVEWREDLKTVLKTAGTESQALTFLFSDTQIKNETFVEDINNMLNSGEVPNIFPNDERMAICEAVRPFARLIYGKAAADMTAQELYGHFIQRVKQNLHIVLAFSPIGDAFRDRLRKFPALVNCCTIDWFTSWPQDALMAVSTKFLSKVSFDSDETRKAIVDLCQRFHTDVIHLSEEFMDSLRRRNYVTPTSYLELIVAYKQNLDIKRVEVSQARKRYEVGLEKLAFASEQVNQMQRELEDLQPELIESAAATQLLMQQIELKMPGVLETRKIVSAEAAVAQGEANIVQQQKDEVEADLAVAIPALEEAITALNTIKPTDINEIKALSKPPERIRMVCKAVCIMLDVKPVRVPDPDNPSKRILDFWGPSQKLLADSNFLQTLMNYDKDNINPKIVTEIKRDFLENEEFDPVKVAKASKAAEGLCRWVFAMITYDKIAKLVAPKKAALAEAEAKLKLTMDALNSKKAALQKVEDDLGALQGQLEAAKQKKIDLETQAKLCDQKIIRANQLLDGLGGERDRWGLFAEQLGNRYNRLTGDVLVSSGVLAYLGPFTAVFRAKQLEEWVHLLKEKNIPCSDHPTLNNTLGDPVRIRQWNIDGLPTDGFSVDNGIVVFNARRWPLIIDPQGQASKWIRNMEKANNLQVIKLTDTNYLRVLENSIQFGSPVLLENVGEELDPSLEPLLLKQLFKQGGVNCIRLGDSTIEYSDMFRFYITTKLRNPHYLPEVSVKVTLLNFMITPEGLQDQLLGIVVSQERPDLEEQRNQLIVESAENKRLLKEIEDRILHIMSSSSGNILEDETAITTLKDSKTLSNEITQKQAIADETEIDINNVRQSYSPVAYSSQILFFCIADLANIEPVYQYSLTWFINLFVQSIINSDKGRDVQKRLENLDIHFTYSLYRNICRSLLEKDKLLFSFLLTTRIMAGKGQLDQKEWYFLLTGGMGLDNPHSNPSADWLGSKNWDMICRLADMEKYNGFREDFIKNIRGWEGVYDSLTPHEESFPGMFAGISGVSRLCALRCIRSDTVVLAIQKFVFETMGEKFVKPPPFDLQACYSDSSATVPLVFILSAGSDPMSAILRAAELMHVQVDPISLGQGQGPKAERLIERAKEKGTWVVLQNCHLAPSWMTTLEKICDELDPDEINAGFRIWCTSYPSDVFPVSVLQNGVKMTIEPPKGLRANLLGSFNADPIANEEFYDSCEKGFEFRRLLFGICFFHAVVQERRLYGPLGWNIPYEFNDSDLRISVQQLVLFLNENSDVPVKALQYTAGECNYGGRVTDDKDRRTLLCILQRFYCIDFLETPHNISPSGMFMVPADGTRESYIKFIDSLPLIAPPEVFGLHDNATLTKDQNDTNNLLNCVLDTERGGGGGGGGSGGSKDDLILSVAADIASKIPPNFDMEFAQLKYPVLWEDSMNTVLCMELIRFNNLLTMVRNTLSNIQKAVKGLVVMSLELEVLGSALFFNTIPKLWKSASYPSLKPLASYVSDLQIRLQFFDDWLQGAPPAVFWLSGFFFTQAFLTGSAQNYARKHTIPIDDIIFDFEMMTKEDYDAGPVCGVYTYGLFLEGARWNRYTHVLTESMPKVLFSAAPIIYFKPCRKAELSVFQHYKCPVYKTSDRRGILATTGHSSNFVCFIHVPTDDSEEHWVERGVAMLTQLDD
eukprot:gene989-1935_t